MKVMDYTVSDEKEKRTDELEDIELYENLGFINSTHKMCTLLVKGNKVSKCEEIHQDVLARKINVAEFVQKMESVFANNKKLQKFIQYVKQKKLNIPELESDRKSEHGL